MKIAQVVCTFLPYQSGMTSVAYYLACNLHERGHDVTVITPDYHLELGASPELPFKIKHLVVAKKINYSILPNGVDLDIFKPHSVGGEFSKYNLPENARVLLFVAGMSKAYFYKGAEVLLRAWAILKKQAIYNNVFLFMVGEGELRSGYENLAQDLGVSDSVRFLGRKSPAKLAQLYNLSTALIIPSLSESLPMVLLEASACAKPTVASDLSSLQAIFNNFGNEFLFKPGDSQDLSEKIKKLLDNPEQAKSIGERAHVWSTDYSWEKIVNKLEKFYQCVV